MWWAGIVFLKLAFFSLCLAGWSTQEWDYAREGVVVNATVTAQGPASRRDRGDMYLAYRFTTEAGQVVAGRAGASKWLGERLGEGATVRVRYVSSDPARKNRLVDQEFGPQPWWLLPLGSFGTSVLSLAVSMACFRASSRARPTIAPTPAT